MNSLLPPGSTPLECRLAQTCSGISDLQVPLRDLWNPANLSGQFSCLISPGRSLWIAGTRAGQKASSARW
ncbi:phage tail protein I [Escherichia coli]|nr:phage tail protein I [Escherichia coli]